MAASCSECGSSIISKSAPLPVTVPPTPIAKYSPLALVDHRPAALLSDLRLTFGNIRAYCSLPTKFLTLRPKPTANSAVLEHWIIFLAGSLPKNHAGSIYEPNSDLVCLGGILMINRFNFPLAISSNFLAITL